MRRTTSVVTALLLAFALAAPSVILADEPDATVPAAELLPLDKPSVTPAETPEPVELDLEELLRVETIRACTPNEEATCAPSCTACVFSANKIWCVGC